MKKQKITSFFHWLKNHKLSKKGLRLYYVLACNADKVNRVDVPQKKLITMCGFADKLELVSAVNELIYNNLIVASWNTGAKNKAAYPVYTLLEIGDKKP